MQAEHVLKEKKDQKSDSKAESSYTCLNLNKILSSNLTETTVHSIANVYNTNDYFLKTIILVCFMASGGCCCYLTVKTLMTFFSYGVLTSTNVVSDIPAECNITFAIRN
jgi:hypothetical protein